MRFISSVIFIPLCIIGGILLTINKLFVSKKLGVSGTKYILNWKRRERKA